MCTCIRKVTTDLAGQNKEESSYTLIIDLIEKA